MTKCPYCAEDIKPDAQKCKHCGEWLQPDNTGNIPIVSHRNKKIGIFWLVGPISMLVIILVLYAVSRFFFQPAADGSINNTAGAIINIVLGFLGIIATMLIIVGIPLGIVYLNKKDYNNVKCDPRSGNGKLSTIPDEITGWSWGAFMFNWIWGIANNVYLSFLVFIPYFSIVWIIVLGINGKKWAWQSKQWLSVDEFKKTQKQWDKWGIVFLILQVLFIILGFVLSFSEA